MLDVAVLGLGAALTFAGVVAMAAPIAWRCAGAAAEQGPLPDGPSSEGGWHQPERRCR